ncbi:MAG: hypothetical protein FDZ70_00975 [Actinobacteria bacterium]|nr:MAG: hypothetical protein FDZ70_00975 [Actinomycetota bacterium]
MTRFLSADDLLSLGGFALLVVVSRVAGPRVEMLASVALASGMLALMWLLARGIRERNADRNPNARVVFWGAIAVLAATWMALR